MKSRRRERNVSGTGRRKVERTVARIRRRGRVVTFDRNLLGLAGNGFVDAA